MDSANPVDLLRRLEQQSQGDQTGRTDELPSDAWQGFVFEVDDLSVVMPLEGDFKIVPFQDVSPLPMARTWLMGMTAIQGEIYTVVDFSAFIGARPTPATADCSLIVLPDAELKSALLVGGRISLGTFDNALPEGDGGEIPERLRPYISRTMIEDGRLRHVMDVAGLSGADEFIQAGLDRPRVSGPAAFSSPGFVSNPM